MIYEAYGMTYEDSDVDYLSYGEAIDQMKNGQCDAAFVTSGLPNATVSELAFSYDMVIVPIDGEGRDNLIEKYPVLLRKHDPGQYIQQQRGRGERIRLQYHACK